MKKKKKNTEGNVHLSLTAAICTCGVEFFVVCPTLGCEIKEVVDCVGHSINCTEIFEAFWLLNKLHTQSTTLSNEALELAIILPGMEPFD